MEFPDLANHCQYQDCNQTDFLPLRCKCGKIFCREHFHSHWVSDECEFAPEAKALNLKSDTKLFTCSQDHCQRADFHEMLCQKCNQHYCIGHRFHPTCLEIDEEALAAKIEEMEAHRKHFSEANKVLQDKITENIRKALKLSTKVRTASKVHLMRVKQKAIGPKTVSCSDRAYFAVIKPVDMVPKEVRIVKEVEQIMPIKTAITNPAEQNCVELFVSSKWSLGRALDSICDTCNIKNDNNKLESIKLRLFRQLDGYCINPVKMDVVIEDLINQELLLQGETLLIEYIDNNVLEQLDETSQICLF